MNSRLAILIASMAVVTALLLNACSRPTSTGENSSSPRESPSETNTRNLTIEKVEVQELKGVTAPTEKELVSAYNSRNLGSPGWRKVSLDLITDTHVTNSFTVINLWHQFENEVRTLFLLEEPAGLKGTSYLLQEKTVSSPEMQVHLFLPAGERRVLAVGQDNFDEGLLGSDFTYNDMRMLLPETGWRYRLTGQTRLAGETAWVVEAVPTSDQLSVWSLIRLYLARDFQLLLGADFHELVDRKTGQSSVSKQMRVQSFKQKNGVWTATQMVMSSLQKRFSVLMLKEAEFSVPQSDPSLFSPDQLPNLATRIQEGWSPKKD